MVTLVCRMTVSLLVVCSATQAQGKYQLVWSDEFSQDGAPDTSKWSYETGFVRNQEAQWYQPQNAYCKNGILVVEARKEHKTNPGYKAGHADWRKNRQWISYTSACLITRNKYQWQYGRFELRARIPIEPGMWPAWWCLGTRGPWPECGEIDMMEYYRDTLLANILCRGTNGTNEWYTTRTAVEKLGGKEWAQKFHTWRMDWNEEYITLFVDDSLLNKVPVSKLINKDGSGLNPFRQPQYMLLNLAIGGQNGGIPDMTKFPKRMEVDWVRVWQESR